MSINFPDISPIAIELGPIVIRWYALAYIAGFLGGMTLAKNLIARYATDSVVKNIKLDDLLLYAMLGIILGGRLGYVLVYNAGYYWHNPMDILQLWQGGMSFHGGLLGVILAIALFAKHTKLPYLAVTDVAATVTPLGIFLGRIANFVNAELYGRVTDVPWGIVFPNAGDLPRHPSQLYQAGLEGLVLLGIMLFLATKPKSWATRGLLSGVFLIGYASFRFIGEFFREPDAQIGFLAGHLSMGQILCVPVLLVGVGILVYRQTKLCR